MVENQPGPGKEDDPKRGTCCIQGRPGVPDIFGQYKRIYLESLTIGYDFA